MTDHRFEQMLLQSAIQYTKEAGQFILRKMKNHIDIERKKNGSDLVTEVDKLSEELLLRRIREGFAGHWILSEEENGQADSYEALRRKGSGYGWILDPIDGTTNFIHKIPHFAISISIVRELEPVIGVVYNPVTEELFYARKNHGAFRNGVPIHVGTEIFIEDALLATGFQALDWKPSSFVLQQMSKFAGKCRNLRIIGAASLELCWLATGRLTGFWHDGLQPWDTAAGVLIVREAGGLVTDKWGNPYKLTDQSLIASNGRIHSALLETIQSNMNDES